MNETIKAAAIVGLLEHKHRLEASIKEVNGYLASLGFRQQGRPRANRPAAEPNIDTHKPAKRHGRRWTVRQKAQARRRMKAYWKNKTKKSKSRS